MAGLKDKPIVINLNMDKETTDYIAKHDYIKLGDKDFISRDRAIMLVKKLANGATTGEKQCNLPVASKHYCKSLSRNITNELNNMENKISNIVMSLFREDINQAEAIDKLLTLFNDKLNYYEKRKSNKNT